MYRLAIAALALLCLLSLHARSADSLETPEDSTAKTKDPTAKTKDPTAMTKNPTTAVLLSLACPGLGQFHNESYWKIPIFTGTAAVSAWLFFANNAKFSETDAQYQAALAEDPNNLTAGRLQTVREVYRDNRDLWGFVFLVTYALAAVDAYVGAHLYDFDVSEDVSLHIGPTRTQLLALHISVTMP